MAYGFPCGLSKDKQDDVCKTLVSFSTLMDNLMIDLQDADGQMADILKYKT